MTSIAYRKPPAPETLRTERLILRPWRDEDLAPFAAMNADPEVARYFVSTLTPEQSDALARRAIEHFGRHGFGPWAVERAGTCDFIGFTGLSIPEFEAVFTPCVEIGWRISRKHWGRGYASEAARVAMDYGFEVLGLEEIVAFTVPANAASLRVMEKIGLVRDEAGDFDHPRVPEGHALKRHVLYRGRRATTRQPG